MALYILNDFSLSMLDREQQRVTPKGYTPRSILNAFSLGYTPRSGDAPTSARFPKSCDDPVALIQGCIDWEVEIVSAVGHANTAAVFSGILGIPVEANRVNVKLESEDVALIGQYIGPRLEEGATELPEGARIEWWTI